VVGGWSFYERKEIRQLLGYLRLAEGRGDIEDVEKCINAPFRFLGKAFVGRVTEAADNLLDDGDSSEIKWAEVVRAVAQQERIQFRQKESAEAWAQILTRMSSAIHEGEAADRNPSTLLEDLITETRFVEWMTREEGADTLEVSQGANVKELVRVAQRFATVKEFLDYVDDTLRRARAQREDKQAGGDRVLLMNVHRSKGLEWPRVWVSGFNESIFPHPMGDQEEERRLAYVAVTRARDVLTVSHVRTMATRAGIRDAQPSRFVGEIQAALTKAKLVAGLPGGSVLGSMIGDEMAMMSGSAQD
jgi:DNA helicase-2/ATP-dependent DNA helicase PcrA